MFDKSYIGKSQRTSLIQSSTVKNFRSLLRGKVNLNFGLRNLTGCFWMFLEVEGGEGCMGERLKEVVMVIGGTCATVGVTESRYRTRVFRPKTERRKQSREDRPYKNGLGERIRGVETVQKCV